MFSYVRAGFLVATSLIALGMLIPTSERTLTTENLSQLPTQQFDKLRKQYQDMTYEELSGHLEPTKFVNQLPFEPTESRYFDLVQYRLELTDSERETFAKNGFVTIDQGRDLSFPRAYEQVYVSDLPVFISSDSILHAFHRSYDEILKEFESSYAHTALGEILSECQRSLAKKAAVASPELTENLHDVDLYLGVARKLLILPRLEKASDDDFAAFAYARAALSEKEIAALGPFSAMGQDVQIDNLIAHIDSLKMQTPDSGGTTAIYGGTRMVDYSQFRPRGHYTETKELSSFFRTMMWLGRADCGWTICTDEQNSLSQSLARRELLNAVLLTELLQDSGGLARLQQLEQTLAFLVGQSDNFGVTQLSRLLKSSGVRAASQAVHAEILQQIQDSIAADPRNSQAIRSQVLASKGRTVPTLPETVFQMFGQRFTIDSFVTSRVVFDEIIYADSFVPRNETTGLDVMAALGNDEATRLLAPQLEKWKYSANLLACREVIQDLDEDFWLGSVYHSWLDTLRCLDSNSNQETMLPSTFRTQAWQRKQLQTQLASWAELRRDNILHAKQSYGVYGCAFPTGYVEPYPHFYAKLKRLAERARSVLGAAPVISKDTDRQAIIEKNRARQVEFFSEMIRSMNMLEQIAVTELEDKPLSAAQRDFLRSTFDNTGKIKFGSASLPDSSGWYCRLYYARHQAPALWSPSTSFPVVADVHSDPNSQQVLEAATGHAKLMVIAINSPQVATQSATQKATVYVGPVSSYYEFWNAAERRMTDGEWRVRLKTDPPPRPEWVAEFESQPVPRAVENPTVKVRRNEDSFSVDKSSTSGILGSHKSISIETVRELAKEKSLYSIDLSGELFGDQAVRLLSQLPDLRSLDLHGSKITDEVGAMLESHKHLHGLNLSGTAVTDTIVPSLKTLNYLIQLDLRDTKITADAAHQLRLQLPDAEVLH